MTSPTLILRLPSADASPGARFEALARQLAAQAQDETLPISARLQFLRDCERYETQAALIEADTILAAHAHEVA